MLQSLLIGSVIGAGIDALDSSEGSDISNLVDGAAIGGMVTGTLGILGSMFE